MAVDFFIKKDDRLPEFQCTLKDATETVVNLSGATVRFIMTNRATGTNKVDAAATVVSAVGGTVKYAWAANDTNEAGSFNAEWEVTFADGRPETFPNDSNLVVKIRADLGGVV